MDESDPSAVGSLSRGRPRQLETCRRRPRDRDVDVGHSKREVVQALAPAGEEPPNRPLLGERLHELDLPLSHLHKRHSGALTGDGSAVPLNKPKSRERDRRLGVEIPDDEGQMREARGGSHRTADGR